jgi:hypothetical protein
MRQARTIRDLVIIIVLFLLSCVLTVAFDLYETFGLLFDKLQVSDRTRAVVEAMRRGLIEY